MVEEKEFKMQNNLSMLFIHCMLKICARFISFRCKERFTETEGGTQYMQIREGVSVRNFQAT